MTNRDDLDRTLTAWFSADAPSTAPRHVLDTILAETRRRAPRPSWLVALRGDAMGTPAFVRGRPARPILLLALMGALIVGLIGGAILAGGGSRLGLSVGPTPTPTTRTTPTTRPTQATVLPTPYVEPEPTLFVSGGSMPFVDVPAGLNPETTAGSWERHAVALLAEYVRQLGWEVGSPRVTAIRLLAPGATYPTTWVDGLDHGGPGFTAERLSWAIDAEGTMITCGTRCAAFGAGTFFFDDASEGLLATGATGATTPIPAVQYRDIVESVGRAFRPLDKLAPGSLDLATILDRMKAAGRLPAGASVDPVYGTVICLGSTPPCQGWGNAEAGQSAIIWWIGRPDVVLPSGVLGGPGPGWDTFDAQTGDELLWALP